MPTLNGGGGNLCKKLFTPLKIYNGTPQSKQGVPLEIQWQLLLRAKG